MKGFENGKIESDRELVARMLDGDQSAWNEFVNRYRNLILYYARRWTYAATYSPGEKSLKMISKTREEGYWHNEAFAWIFEEFAIRKGLWEHFLKKSGQYNSLEHFLRVVLRPNGPLHIDYIRSYYDRRQTLPNFIELSADEQQITRLLKDKKSEAEMAQILGWPLVKVQEIKLCCIAKQHERDVFKMIRAGKPEDKIAQKLKLPVEKVLTIKKALGEKLFDAICLPGKMQKGSNMEKRVYNLLKARKPEQQIAAELGLSLEDVKKHRKQIMQNLIKDRQLPPVLHKCIEEEQTVFILLKFAISENQIIQELELEADARVNELQEIKTEIEKALFKGNQDDFPIARIEMSEEPADEAPITSSDNVLLKEAAEFFSLAWKKLLRKDKLLLWLAYVENLTSQEILEAYRKIDKELLKKKTIHEADSKNVDKAIENAKTRLLELFKQEYPDWQEARLDSDTIKTFLKYMEQKQNGKE